MSRSFSASVIVFSLYLAPGGAAPLDSWLESMGKRIETFWDQISSVSCTESVAQTKLGPNGKAVLSRTASYDYVIMLSLNGNEFTVDESRIQQGKPEKTARLPLLVTGGFSTMLLIFHPLFQSSFEFQQMPDEQGLHKIAFRHVPGTRSPAVLELRNREYPIPWQGFALADPQTGSIVRVRAELAVPMDDVGLKSLAVDAAYSGVAFSREEAPYWLPNRVLVEARTPKQHWTNLHTFTRFKRFGVDTKSTVGDPQ